MFNNDELIVYYKDFCRIGLTNEAEQKKVLEFLYTLGTIAYNSISTLNPKDYGKEENK